MYNENKLKTIYLTTHCFLFNIEHYINCIQVVTNKNNKKNRKRIKIQKKDLIINEKLKKKKAS